MKYKVGDKVIVEIGDVDYKDTGLPYSLHGVTNRWISDGDILGKLSDFQQEMNENQEFVLNGLKKEFGRKSPMVAVYRFIENNSGHIWDRYQVLTDEDEFEVLKAFAEWGLSE